MKNLFSKNIKRTITLILLGFFIFSFLQSEIRCLDSDNEHNCANCFCEILKNTNSSVNILRGDLPKLELNKDLCIHCFEEIKAQETQTSFETTDHHLKAKPFTDLYLFNSTFLI